MMGTGWAGTGVVVVCLAALLGSRSANAAAEFKVVAIKSTHDGTQQGALLYLPPDTDGKPVPLLVVLHTWSGNYKQKQFGNECLAEAARRKWAVVQPDFRGPNFRPQACASEAAVQDVLDAVEYVKRQTDVDPQRIYLVGTSGGGHMALVMAGRAPQVWAGVSAWVPISDLAAWHRQRSADGGKRGGRYAKNVEAVCGGPPGASPEVDAQYRLRSPLTHLTKSKGLPIDINAGIDDGHTGSVPISHTLRAFNLLAEVNGQPGKMLSPEQVASMTKTRTVPPELAAERVDEPGRKHKVLFRRQAGPARVTIFQGGHAGDMPTAIGWLARQKKKPNGER